VDKPLADEQALSELVNSALTGDEAARQSLFARLRDVAKLTALGRLRGHAVHGNDASDVAQESMLKLIRKIESLPADCDPKVRAYVATTVVNTIRKHAHSAKKEADAQTRLLGENGRDITSPSKRAHAAESCDLARLAAVTELSEEQRMALNLILGERLSPTECAARMNRTQKAIEHLVERATRAILARTTGEETTFAASPREMFRRALLRYLRETAAGRSVDREEFLRRYPKHGAALAPLLTELEQMRRVIRGPED